jgi:biopolymer transport protein ExbB
MKNFFNVIVIALSLAVAYIVFFFYMGNPDNFNDPDIKHEPKPGNVPGMIYTGGPLVGLLMSFVLIAITFVFERSFSIGKAKGKGNPALFIKSVINKLTQGDLDGAVAECDKQRGSMANVLRAAIVRFKEIENDPEFPGEKKVAEVQRAIDESMNLETPLLEKNLVILSTIASIAVLVGLLGTTIGMIRAFQALALSGTVSAIQLSIGISEALYNTAGGLIGAIIAIVGYNYFTTKVDNFVYMIDEAILNITQIFTVRLKS